jgi:ATP-dependent RNA helicase DDX19/DBP5
MLQTKLKEKDVSSNILIGGIENKDRDTIIDNFRKQIYKCLISTNVLARGIDVPEVDLVINYDVPTVMDCGFMNPDYANFMHRVGRTGRFGTDGLSLTITTDEHDEEFVDLIAKHYEIEITKLKNFEDLKKIFEEMRGDLLKK